MIDKKKVVLVGTALVVAIGCNVLAKSKTNLSSGERGGKRGYLKAQFSDSQKLESEEISGDKVRFKCERKMKEGTRGNTSKDFKNLTEEEKAALEEKKSAKKEKYENLTEEEKAALKEKRESMKQERSNKKEKLESLSEEEKAKLKEKFENLSEEEKEALKEKKATKKERKIEKGTSNNQEV